MTANIKDLEGTITSEIAIWLSNSGWWKALPKRSVALAQPKLCMPFGEYCKCVSDATGRDVWTTEYLHPEQLIAEILGEIEPPKDALRDCLETFEEHGVENVAIVETPDS